MEKMGDKVSARKLAKKAGIPVIPGTNTAVGDKNALKQAKKIGFPLMVKAAAGGGGIGMQIVHSEDELSPIIARARHQAQNSFGSSRLYFERYLEHASHIEVQILADERKKTIHLLERDCSVQRRNQKIVEIAPSIKMTRKLRRELTKYALKLAKHVGYTNAGTVEFLVTPKGEIFFLEMNMRLQVEHGITEMITGVDLVEMQLRIASGQRMPYRQKDIANHGFAMEARIYAEDPDMFLPSSGVIYDPSGAHNRRTRPNRRSRLPRLQGRHLLRPPVGQAHVLGRDPRGGPHPSVRVPVQISRGGRADERPIPPACGHQRGVHFRRLRHLAGA